MPLNVIFFALDLNAVGILFIAEFNLLINSGSVFLVNKVCFRILVNVVPVVLFSVLLPVFIIKSLDHDEFL